MNEKPFSSNNPINKDSNLSITKNLDNISEFTSISNLHVLPNSKMKSLLILSTLFNFGVLISALIYSLITKDYLINVSYHHKNNNIIDKTKDFNSVYKMNVYMFYIFLFLILFLEISKIFYFFFGVEVKKLMKFIYMETSYWFIVIKVFFGFNLLISFVHVNDFNFVFITSTGLNFLIIRKFLK